VNKIKIYTDGGGNTNHIGLGVYIIYPWGYQEISKYLGNEGSNNIAELKAIKEGLLVLCKKKLETNHVMLFSDSKYALGVINNSWWNPKKNIGLIKGIKRIVKQFPSLKMFHVKGHAGNPGNEKADKLATWGKNKHEINRFLKKT